MTILNGDWSRFGEMTDPRLCDWGPYHGLALEPDCGEEAGTLDLAFRSVLIAHYVGRAAGGDASLQ